MHSYAAESQLTPLLKGQEMGMHNDVPTAFSMESAFSSAAANHAPHPVSMNHQQLCRRCHHDGVDVKILGCGCCFHAVSSQKDSPFTFMGIRANESNTSWPAAPFTTAMYSCVGKPKLGGVPFVPFTRAQPIFDAHEF